MTADSPDKGTLEHEAMSDFMKLYQQNAIKYGHLRDMLNHTRDYYNLTIIEPDFLKEVRLAFGLKTSPGSGGLKYATQAKRFFIATGGTPDNKEGRERLLKMIRPLLETEQDISPRLTYFMELSRKLNFADCYIHKVITPGLVDTFQNVDELTPEMYDNKKIADPSFYLPYLLESKQLDFAPFKGENDTGENWYFNYRIDTTPVPLLTRNFDELAKIAAARYYQARIGFKEQVKQALEGIKPSEEWLRGKMHLEGEALEKALKEYIIKPVKEKPLLQFAKAVEMQYQLRQQEQTPLDYAAPFKTEQEAGFYVNLVTRKIYDLRPFTKELHALFSVKSWDYLKDFATAIREAIEEVKNEQLKEQPVKADIQKADKINYPVDKVNNNLWGTLENTSDGQLAFSTVKTGKQKEVTILAAINFVNMEGVKITKKLTNFDKRVYIAVAALWNAGNKVITLTQIHYAMGNTKRPAAYQLEKINEAVSKMTTAKLFLDNALEVEKLKYNYGKFKYDGALLPMERMTATIKGQLSDAAIHIFREPPLMTFARERNQITTFDVKLLQSPVSKTDGNLAIEDYLLERIAGAKQAASKGKKVVINTILYETLFQKVGITDRKQKSRAIEKIKTYLDYYKSNGYIKSYVAEAKQVTFYF